ncbi:hypothetical protein OH76DRAFT_1408891 [Lentinus brumalis]|uniref:Uncharacterized protein n=1 Tax=Lentinus brumalis TaxID=2498619 RepID=A0A371CWK4_9APHY|nr:hypothetical protein OH76DRAFT_1408891 [Polyporus brumalis]
MISSVRLLEWTRYVKPSVTTSSYGESHWLHVPTRLEGIVLSNSDRPDPVQFIRMFT